MHRATLAHRILALTTTEDRAAAVVGDLLEEEASHSRGWFWRAVARSTVAFAWLNVARTLSGRHSAPAGAEFREQLMTLWRFVWSRKWLVVVPVVLFTIASTLAAHSMPVRYRADVTILVVPQRVPESMVPTTINLQLDYRLHMISAQILSRRRLERVVNEFNLYPEERRNQRMGDVIERMRREDVSIAINRRNADSVTFTVSYLSPDPRAAQKVAERLANLFVQENLEDRGLLAESSVQFIKGQIGDIAREVDEFAARMDRDRAAQRPSPPSVVLEYEELQKTYRTLLAQRHQARMAVQLERNQIGEQFRVLDGARLPDRPEGLERGRLSLLGAAAGLALGLVLLLGSAWRRPAAPTAAPTHPAST